MNIRCINCGNENAPSYYLPKELAKLETYFCPRCVKLLIFKDLRYIQNEDEVLRLCKREEERNERLYCDNTSIDNDTGYTLTYKI